MGFRSGCMTTIHGTTISISSTVRQSRLRCASWDIGSDFRVRRSATMVTRSSHRQNRNTIRRARGAIFGATKSRGGRRTCPRRHCPRRSARRCRLQPWPGTQGAAVDAECKARMAVLAGKHRARLIDWRIVSPLTTNDENYWDPLHYRLPIAERLAHELAEAVLAQRPSVDGSYRIVVP